MPSSKPLSRPHPLPSVFTAVAILSMCSVFWGLSFVLTDVFNQVSGWYAPQSNYLKKYSHSCFYIAVRFFFALVLLFLIRPNLLRNTTRTEWLEGLRLGFLFGAAMILQTIALFEILPSRSAFLTSLTILFTPLLVTLLNRKLPSVRLLVACSIATLGSAALTEMLDLKSFRLGYRNTLEVGDFLTIIAAFIFSYGIIEIDRVSQLFDPKRISAGMFFGIVSSGAVGIIVSCFIKGAPNQTLFNQWTTLMSVSNFWVLILPISAFCTLLPFHLMNTYQHAVSPTHAALIYTLEPIFATIWALFLPELLAPYFGATFVNEETTTPLYVGGALIVLANVLLLFTPERPRPGLAEAEPH